MAETKAAVDEVVAAAVVIVADKAVAVAVLAFKLADEFPPVVDVADGSSPPKISRKRSTPNPADQTSELERPLACKL